MTLMSTLKGIFAFSHPHPVAFTPHKEDREGLNDMVWQAVPCAACHTAHQQLDLPKCGDACSLEVQRIALLAPPQLRKPSCD